VTGKLHYIGHWQQQQHKKTIFAGSVCWKIFNFRKSFACRPIKATANFGVVCLCVGQHEI